MDRRDELLEREERSWNAFVAAVETVPSDRRSIEGVVPGWSVKDVVRHCGGWAMFAANHLQTLGSGAFADPFEDAPDEHWDRVSQEMIEDSRAESFEDVLREAEERRARARSAWKTSPAPSDEAARFFADETSEHYDEHRAEIEAFRERS